MLLNIVVMETSKPLSIPHVKEIGSINGVDNSLYVKLATPQVCEDTIERINSSGFPISVKRAVGSDAIFLENIENFFVKNK